MAALFAEIEGKSGKYRDRRVVSVFIGGGTPSRLTGEQMGKLMACIRRHFSLDPAAEITTEVNPGTVSEEKLRTFRKAGINRLSIGMQSAQDEELRELGRIHDFAGEKVCIHVITPAHSSFIFASLKVFLISSLVISVGFHITS